MNRCYFCDDYDIDTGFCHLFNREVEDSDNDCDYFLATEDEEMEEAEV